MCFAALAYIFKNVDIWGTVFLVFLGIGIIAGTIFLIRQYIIEMIDRKISDERQYLHKRENANITSNNMLHSIDSERFDSRINTLQNHINQLYAEILISKHVKPDESMSDENVFNRVAAIYAEKLNMMIPEAKEILKSYI